MEANRRLNRNELRRRVGKRRTLTRKPNRARLAIVFEQCLVWSIGRARQGDEVGSFSWSDTTR